MSVRHPVALFIELRQEIFKGWREQRKAAERALRSPIVIVQTHCILVGLLCIAAGVVIIVPPLAQQLRPWGLLAGVQPWGVYILTLIVWLVLLAIPSGLIYGPNRIWLLVIYTLFWIPMFISVSDAMARSDTTQLWREMIVYIGLSLAFLLLVVVFIILLSSWTPEPVFLLFTSMRAGEKGLVFPSYETVIRDVDQHQGLVDLLKHVSHAEMSRVALIAQHKQAGINGRLQTLALVSAVLALLGLATLVVAQNAIVGVINRAVEQFSMMVGAANQDIIIPPGVVLVLSTLGLFVTVILRYTFLTYRELRLLEIINLVCALRLAAPAPAAPRAHAATPPVLNVPATTQPRPLLLVTLLLGLALLRRMLTRR